MRVGEIQKVIHQREAKYNRESHIPFFIHSQFKGLLIERPQIAVGQR